jgi:hypothetical protein
MQQDDDLLHSYTVAKIRMDCYFNPYYIPIVYYYEYDMKYIKLDGTLVDKIYYEANQDHTYKMAFVGCSYKCS